jgi:hypothetical protein
MKSFFLIVKIPLYQAGRYKDHIVDVTPPAYIEMMSSPHKDYVVYKDTPVWVLYKSHIDYLLCDTELYK